MLEKLKKLIDVKSIVTISLTIVFCVETLRGNVEINDFMKIYLMKKEGNE